MLGAVEDDPLLPPAPKLPSNSHLILAFVERKSAEMTFDSGEISTGKGSSMVRKGLW